MPPQKKQWLQTEVSPDKVQKLYEELGTSVWLCQILVQRGIESYEAAKTFFRPSLEDLHDPFLMKDMQKALDRISTAISNGEKIMLYGDYDVDGTMAVSLLYNFLKTRYDNIIYYIPHRLNEGYGISEQGIEKAKDEAVNLFISLDCGIKNNSLIDKANSYAMDCIIIDHHTPGKSLPNAHAILNPKQEGDTYPFKELSGAGIAFKLISAWDILENGETDEALRFLDLAALSTIADIVPLQGENRTIASLGLDYINTNVNPVIQEIKKKAGAADKILTDRDLAFMIAPRINALGRLQEGKEVVDVFTSTDENFILEKISSMDSVNEERKTLDQSIADDALSMIDTNPAYQNKKSTVLCSELWHKGVIGIVASRVLEKYYKPTIICTRQDDTITGSARSVRGFDILAALDDVSDLFDSYGGHKYAAGIRLPAEKFEEFVERFEQSVADKILLESETPTIKIDAVLADFDFDLFKFYNTIKQMSPFGEANPEPIFRINNVQISQPRILKEKHLSAVVRKNGKSLRAIGFNLAELHTLFEQGEDVDLCFQFTRNDFRGNSSIELKLIDARPSLD